jgi:hypothetical protein
MAMTEKTLFAGSAPTSLGAASYTVPSSTKTRPTEIILCNNAGATRTIRVYLVPNSGSADQSNAIFYDYDLPQGRPVIQPMNTFLATAGDGIFLHGSGTNIAVRISGIEKT